MSRIMDEANKTENLRKYRAHLSEIGTKNLVPPKNTERNALMKELAAEGMKILAEEEKSTSNPCGERKKLTEALANSSSNPYIRARNKVLMDLPEERRKSIEEMEKTGKTNNRIYDEFVKMQRTIGDKFSS